MASVRFIPKVHKYFDNLFKNAPKTYEEALEQGKLPPIPVGKNHKTVEKEDAFRRNLFLLHIENKCSCKNEIECLFSQYANKKITEAELFLFLE